jgi:hypothetical protein
VTTKNPERPQTPSQIARGNRQRLAAEDGAKAIAEINKSDAAVRKNMLRLRELRLAKEASAPADVPAVKKAKPKATKAKAKSAV